MQHVGVLLAGVPEAGVVVAGVSAASLDAQFTAYLHTLGTLSSMPRVPKLKACHVAYSLIILIAFANKGKSSVLPRNGFWSSNN